MASSGPDCNTSVTYSAFEISKYIHPALYKETGKSLENAVDLKKKRAISNYFVRVI